MPVEEKIIVQEPVRSVLGRKSVLAYKAESLSLLPEINAKSRALLFIYQCTLSGFCSFSRRLVLAIQCVHQQAVLLSGKR